MWFSKARVARRVTSTVAGPTGAFKAAPRSPPSTRRTRASPSADTGDPPLDLGARPAQHTPLHLVERAQIADRPAHHALVQIRVEALRRQQLQEEGGHQQRRVVGGQGPQPAQQHLVQPEVGVTLLRHLVARLQQRLRLRQPVEVLPHRPEHLHRLRLGDDVELAPPSYSNNDTCTIGSSRDPKRDLVLRTPLATARTLPRPAVSRVTMRSASPSLIVRSTTPCSR